MVPYRVVRVMSFEMMTSRVSRFLPFSLSIVALVVMVIVRHGGDFAVFLYLLAWEDGQKSYLERRVTEKEQGIKSRESERT